MEGQYKVHTKTQNDKSANSISQSRSDASLRSANSPAEKIMFLQRTAGNQAVQKLIKSGALQAKLKIGQPNDIYEQEADRVAEQVMRMPEPQAVSSGTLTIQRACPMCEEEKLRRQPIEGEEEKEKFLQTKEISRQNVETTQDLESRINAIRSGGQPLAESERSFFEPRFGYDFSQVRLHTGTQAATVAEAVNARAFTLGKDVVFGEGQYASEKGEGRKLMAHELTHIIQQNGAFNIRSIKENNFASNELVLRKSSEKCKDSKYETNKGYVHEKMVKSDKGMYDIVNRLLKQGKLTQQWRLGWYIKQVLFLNSVTSQPMHSNKCYIFPKNIKDPNIGTLPTLQEAAKENKALPEKTSILNVVVATIYAEQAADDPEQHKYIWYSMIKRIKSYEKPGKLYTILNEYDAFKNMKARRDFGYAVMHLRGKKLTKLTKRQEFKPSVVDKIKKMVSLNWSKKEPEEAGMFYIHWNEGAIKDLVFLWDKYIKYSDRPEERAKKCALEIGRNKFGKVELSKTLWKNKPTKTDRPKGTMFVFKRI